MATKESFTDNNINIRFKLIISGVKDLNNDGSKVTATIGSNKFLNWNIKGDEAY